MDSYNIFGDDGSGMLEGLTDLGGSDSFAGNSTSGVPGDNKDDTDSTYRQPYSQGGAQQESSIQKLPSFGGSTGGGISGGPQPMPTPGGGPPAPEFHDYGAYTSRPRLPQPLHGPLHPPHHVHPSHSYQGYHPGPDPMYGMPEQPGIGDMWTGAPGANRYAPLAYRHSYDHQPKMHQYTPQQIAETLQIIQALSAIPPMVQGSTVREEWGEVGRPAHVRGARFEFCSKRRIETYYQLSFECPS